MSDLRSAVAAAPGHRLVRADLGQIEPRVLAVVSGDPSLALAASAGRRGLRSAGARAEGVGANVGAWLAHPDDALALSLLRTATGSNETLLQADPTQPARRVLQGRPLLVSPT